VTGWLQEYVVEPARDLLASIPIGDEQGDIDQCDKLSTGIEGVLRAELAAQYRPWPRESTTDGTSVDVCRRLGDDTIEVIGMSSIDFGGERFPVRAVIELSADHSNLTGFTAQIGEVDPRTGAPPRFPQGTLILPRRDDQDRYIDAELLVGRRARSINWRTAIGYPFVTFGDDGSH
jgi:hypothetical protein